MATTTGSPRGAMLLPPARPAVVLVAGPVGIHKSATIARWCEQLEAMHISPKTERYKQYACATGIALGAMRTSPRRHRLMAELEQFAAHHQKKDRYVFDHPVYAHLQLLGDTIVFVDVVDCEQARYYLDFDPVLVYIDNRAAEERMPPEPRAKLHELKRAAFSIVDTTGPFPMSAALLRAVAAERPALFRPDPDDFDADDPLPRTHACGSLC